MADRRLEGLILMFMFRSALRVDAMTCEAGHIHQIRPVLVTPFGEIPGEWVADARVGGMRCQ